MDASLRRWTSCGPRSAASDAYGHGTHVAGIAAGGVTTRAGRFSGVAPGAHLVNLRVLDGKGQGTTSDVIAAIEWAIANQAIRTACG